MTLILFPAYMQYGEEETDKYASKIQKVNFFSWLTYSNIWQNKGSDTQRYSCWHLAYAIVHSSLK